MKLAIMQPYFLPYAGYFQLMAAVDAFVVYDNIKYTKKGWINRNRILVNGQDALFSLPLKKGSDALNIVERELSSAFERTKLLNQFRGAYGRAPYFSEVFPHLEKIVNYPRDNLFEYLFHSLTCIADLLDIKTTFIISSSLPVDENLKGQDKVLAICHAMDAQNYINAIGGQALYSKEDFDSQGVTLNFIQYQERPYAQFDKPFVSCLSIVDVLMFNSLDSVRDRIKHNYTLV
ncbi:WbqC family protein [Atlantibacter sp.]|uniref:WbqC family protein n=1 Tax=Atlantibacter sp. TaxID=1903473 RepID=UPI0028977B4E|nr:WbqC family protein [Atlantibacter sp.]